MMDKGSARKKKTKMREGNLFLLKKDRSQYRKTNGHLALRIEITTTNGEEKMKKR